MSSKFLETKKRQLFSRIAVSFSKLIINLNLKLSKSIFSKAKLQLICQFSKYFLYFFKYFLKNF